MLILLRRSWIILAFGTSLCRSFPLLPPAHSLALRANLLTELNLNKTDKSLERDYTAKVLTLHAMHLYVYNSV